jgi:hypothetical protein
MSLLIKSVAVQPKSDIVSSQSNHVAHTPHFNEQNKGKIGKDRY